MTRTKIILTIVQNLPGNTLQHEIEEEKKKRNRGNPHTQKLIKLTRIRERHVKTALRRRPLSHSPPNFAWTSVTIIFHISTRSCADSSSSAVPNTDFRKRQTISKASNFFKPPGNYNGILKDTKLKSKLKLHKKRRKRKIFFFFLTYSDSKTVEESTKLAAEIDNVTYASKWWK